MDISPLLYLISGAKSKNKLGGYVALLENTTKKKFVCDFMILNH